MNFLSVHRIFYIGLVGLSIHATPVCAEQLEAAVRAAIANHPSVTSAQQTLNAANETRREELSGYFPELSASATGGRIFGDNSTSRGLSVTRGEGYSYLWEGSITARQMLFDGFETSKKVASAKAKQKSADLGLSDITETLALRTVQVYVEVMRAYEGLAMLKAQEGKVDDYVRRIKTGLDEGTADEAQYQQARDVKAVLESFIADYEGQVTSAQAQYFELTGRFPEGDMAVPKPNVSLIPGDVAEAVSYAQDNHPGLKSALYTAKSGEHDIGSEQAQLYPDVTGELSYLKSDKEDVIGGEVDDARALVRMNWNFETGGAQLARIRKKRYEHQALESRAEELKRQLETNVRLSYAELTTAKSQLDNQKKRQDLNGKLFETYGVQFEGARINLVQLMQADNQLFNTKLERMVGEYRLLSAQYAVLASMGRLQEALSLNLADAGPVSGEPQTNEQE